MGPKDVETTWNINNTFGPGTANKGTVQWWFKKFCKVDESLEYEEHSGQPSKVDNKQLRVIIKADPLTVTWEVANELNIKHSMVIWHLKQIGKVKDLNMWVSHELIKKGKKQTNVVLMCLLFFYMTTMNDLSIVLWKVDSWQLVMTSLVDGLKRSTKALPKARLVIRKESWSLFCGLLLAWSTISFWIPEKSLYLGILLSKMNAQMHST